MAETKTKHDYDAIHWRDPDTKEVAGETIEGHVIDQRSTTNDPWSVTCSICKAIVPLAAIAKKKAKAQRVKHAGPYVTVDFEKVGGGERSWSETFPKVNYDSILRAIRKSGALASKNLEIEVEEIDGKTRGTIFVGGFRAVGKFTITKVAAVK